MFGRLFALRSFVFSFLCTFRHSVVIICAGKIPVLFKLLVKFRYVFKHSESLSSFACDQNIKDDIPTALEAFPCFETKRNETNTDPPRKRSRNARVTYAEELGTMSKNNLRGITLGIRLIWGIHSLTLIRVKVLASRPIKLQINLDTAPAT